MPTLAQRIESKCHAFAQEMTAVVMESVRDAFGAAPARATTSRRLAGRPKGKTGAKRPPEALAALTEQLETYVHQNPGQGIEQIGDGMACSTRELALPVKKLIASKKLRTEGEKRSTRYWPAKAGK